VGGLKDTVIDIADDPDNATGFIFEQPSSSALLSCIQRALLFYHEAPKVFEQTQQRGMQTRFTWEAAAQGYQALYLG
jgi:starch synthase